MDWMMTLDRSPAEAVPQATVWQWLEQETVPVRVQLVQLDLEACMFAGQA